LFFIDASQSVPHFQVDVQELWCDALFFTGHKIMADSGIGVLWWKKEFLEKLRPSIWWWWAISWVKKDSFRFAGLPDAFEPGTPNMTWAVSLLRALEYIDRIWGYEKIEKIEWELVEYFLEKLKHYQNIHLIWSFSSQSRVGVFSFNVEGIHPNDVSDYMADNNICIRSGQHCAEPLMIEKWITASCRVSFYIYNTREEIDRFFEVIDDLQKALW
jgi:cysteine desulfurase/selenocysteine lyase